MITRVRASDKDRCRVRGRDIEGRKPGDVLAGFEPLVQVHPARRTSVDNIRAVLAIKGMSQARGNFSYGFDRSPGGRRKLRAPMGWRAVPSCRHLCGVRRRLGVSASVHQSDQSWSVPSITSTAWRLILQQCFELSPSTLRITRCRRSAKRRIAMTRLAQNARFAVRTLIRPAASRPCCTTNDHDGGSKWRHC